MADIDQKTLELTASIRESVSQLAAQIAALNERYRRITGATSNLATVSMSGGGGGGGAGGAVKRGPGRPPKSASTGTTHAAESKAPKASKQSKSRKRIRRTAEQLKEQATSIVDFIRKGGAAGVKGSSIRSEFGQILPSIKVFLDQFGGKGVKTKGEKAGMTYHAD